MGRASRVLVGPSPSSSKTTPTSATSAHPARLTLPRQSHLLSQHRVDGLMLTRGVHDWCTEGLSRPRVVCPRVFVAFSLLIENNPYICDKSPPREVDPPASGRSSTSTYSISIDKTVSNVHLLDQHRLDGLDADQRGAFSLLIEINCYIRNKRPPREIDPLLLFYYS